MERGTSDEWWASLASRVTAAVSQVLSLGAREGGHPAATRGPALGPYVSDPEPGALMVLTRRAETGLSPQMGAFVSPIRLALVDDVHAGVVDTRLVTRLSGDGRITWRNLGRTPDRRGHGDDRVCVPTGHVPRLSLHDAAVAARLREIPYPTVRTDPDFGARMRTPARAAGRD